jgi:transmembrane sensor
MKLRDGLREADRVFQQTPLPPEALSGLRRKVLDAEPARPKWPLLLVAGAAAVALAAFVLWPKAPEVEDIRLAAGESYVPAAPRGVQVAASADALLHRERDRVRVRSGIVTFTVEKRSSGEAPVRVDVSHGTIEVVGTRFTIRQRDDGGDVTLHEGVIRFGEHVLRAGETLEWPEKPAPPPVVAPVAPQPEQTPEPVKPPPPEPHPHVHKEPAVIHETDAAWLLDEVALLRSRGEYAEAVRLLDKGLDGIVLPATRERFSYELGSILTYQLGDKAAACRQWAKHEAAFPHGRYARELRSAKEHLQCGR